MQQSKILNLNWKKNLKNVNILKSESDRFAELDFMLDGETSEWNFTLHYLRDNSDNYYITEVTYEKL